MAEDSYYLLGCLNSVELPHLRMERNVHGGVYRSLFSMGFSFPTDRQKPTGVTHRARTGWSPILVREGLLPSTLPAYPP